jgi:HSP20 family protein
MRQTDKATGRGQSGAPGRLAERRRIPLQDSDRPLGIIRAKLDLIFEELGIAHHAPPVVSGTESWFGAGAVAPIQQDVWDPDVSIYRRGDTVVVRAVLPGLDRDHVYVDVGTDVLVISGAAATVLPTDTPDHHRSERNHGVFFRKIPLVEGADAEHCVAHFRDGVLEVEFQLPHDPTPKRKHIEIT